MRGAHGYTLLRGALTDRPPSSTGHTAGLTAGHASARSILCAVVLGCAALGLTGCSASTQAQPSAMTSQTPTTPPHTGPSSRASAHATTSAGPAAPGAVTSGPAAQAASPAAVRISVAPAQLPGYTTESWTAQTAGQVRDVTGHDIELNECATVHGASTWQQQAYTSSGGNSAILETYTFPAAADAQAAYTAVLSGMQSCQATSRALQTANGITADAVTQQTASATDAVAFERTWTGVEGVSAAGPQTNHLYIAERGSTVLILHFDELAAGATATPYDVRNDPAVLSMLTAALAGQTGGE